MKVAFFIFVPRSEIGITETAKAFLSMGLSVEQVANGTRLSIEEVERIKQELDC